MNNLDLRPLVFISLILLFFTSCKKSQSEVKAELAALDLLRGELVLCSSDQFGEVSFSLSCSYETRQTFDLAVSLLHSFEYEEAEKAFVQVLDSDPECAMAYWGVAMSITHSLWYQSDKSYLEKGSKLLEIAEKLPAGERERDYLEAIAAYYKDYDKLDKKTRELLYEKKMEALYIKYEEDKEAAVFYALALTAAADSSDKEYVKQLKSGKILEDLFIEEPNHPGIAHYIIHNYDHPELAHKALSTARRYASIAPASSHAQHMPSHIFTRLGLWDESIESNVNSASSAKCYAEGTDMDGHWFSELHAMGYLVYAYLQKGDNAKAIEQYDYMKTMYKVYPTNISAIAYPFAAIPARIAMENGEWEQAANLEIHESEIDWNNFPWQKALVHFSRSIGSSNIKDFDAAQNEIETLKLLKQKILENGNEGFANQVAVQIKISEGLMSFRNDQIVEGLKMLEEAIVMEDIVGKSGVTPGKLIPAREFLGNALLELNEPNKALLVFEENLNVNPNRFNGIYGAATAAKEAGDIEKANMYFEDLLNIVENSNSDRIELNEARNSIGQNI